MSKLFSTCLLVQEGSAAPELVFTDLSLCPGRKFPLPRGKSVLIGGGFEKISPESNIPLSPSLYLNYTLGTFSPQQLKVVAEAELVRRNEMQYRSYTLDADNRVCVIGENAGEIMLFIDTYGGVLAIEPLLLKGFHPEIDTAVELYVESQEQHCRLEYQVRSPINPEICTYCGACGPACPERCISETLFVDFAACTFCKECETACRSHAIDVHSALDKVLEIPAIIVLGDIQLDLPIGTGSVYREDQLPAYFASLFPFQVDEVVTWHKSLCQYSSRFDKGCDLCLSSCPYGAITQDRRGVVVNSLKCQECGACVAVCPTGALQNEKFNDLSFFHYFQHDIIPQGGTVVIGGEEDLHKLWWRQQSKRRENVFFLQYENVQSLSLFHCLYLLQRGARRILFLFGDEVDHLVPQFLQQLTLGNEIIGHLCGIGDALASCRVSEFSSVMDISPPGSFGRQSLSEFVNRRQGLSVMLQSMVESSGRQVDMHPKGYLPFATVTCNRERCTQCMACLNDCRIGAMGADRQQLHLTHIGAMCVGCGLCVLVCPEDALTISPQFTVSKEFFIPVELAKAEPMTCKSCGKVFGTKKSFDRVMAILAKKEAVDTSHFEYCETCRVVKLFESH